MNYRQGFAALLGMSLGLAVFILAERLAVPRYVLAISADQRIPFLPLSWAVYVLFFPYVAVLAALSPTERFRAFAWAAAAAFAVALACFLAFPEAVPRPDPALIDNAFLRQRLTRMWRIDAATNGCPSLHVAITCLAAWMASSQRHGRAAAMLGMLICLSTLTMKQHTLADVLGGTVLATLTAFAVRRLAPGGIAIAHR